VLGENDEAALSGSDLGRLLADLLEGGARRRNLSENSLAAYERTWRAFLAWATAMNFDPRCLPFPEALEAYSFLGEGKNATSIKQIRAALFLRLPALGPEKPICQDRASAPEGAQNSLPSSRRHPRAPLIPQSPPARLWLCPRVPPGQRPFPDRLPVRGVDPAHVGRLPEGGRGNRGPPD
jgi:hypothetical protein